MVNFWKSPIINRVVLYSTICVFTTATITPIQAEYHNGEVKPSFNEINFGIRIEKLIEKTKKYFNAKDNVKLMEVMFDIKHEIEGYTGKKIDIEKSFAQVEKEAKAKGQKIDKNHLKILKNRFKTHEKRADHKAVYMAHCMEFDIPYNAVEEQILYENYMTSSPDYFEAKSNHGKDDDEENVLPLRVTIGVTMALVGIFLYVVPFPICKAAAPWVLDTGLAFLGDQAITEYENQNKKDDKKK